MSDVIQQTRDEPSHWLQRYSTLVCALMSLGAVVLLAMAAFSHAAAAIHKVLAVFGT